MEPVDGLLFNFDEKVVLHHPNNKFWAATIESATVKFQVGKVKNGEDLYQEFVEKIYDSVILAKASVKAKIS
jgi:hypothetical protein